MNIKFQNVYQNFDEWNRLLYRLPQQLGFLQCEWSEGDSVLRIGHRVFFLQYYTRNPCIEYLRLALLTSINPLVCSQRGREKTTLTNFGGRVPKTTILNNSCSVKNIYRRKFKIAPNSVHVICTRPQNQRQWTVIKSF